jgi:hypothetical protein
MLGLKVLEMNSLTLFFPQYLRIGALVSEISMKGEKKI